jgi:CubicO group peptidase (beta-lactamase class C family)
MRTIRRARLSRREFISIGCAAALVPCVALGRPDSDGPISASLRRALERFSAAYIQSMNAPGMTLALAAKNGDVLTTSVGFADPAARSRILPADLFQIGSISKSFAALAVLQMQDEGKLDLYRPILSYLPWLPIEQPFGPVTLHHLLTHSSGFAEDLPMMPKDGRRWRPGFAPGTRFHYSNWAFEVIGRLVEDIDGCPYAQAIERRILRPLEMHESGAAITPEIRARQVKSYVPREDDRPYPRHGALVAAGPLLMTAASGCVVATSPDMGKYLRMLACGGLTAGGRLVSEHAFAQFSTPHIRAPEFGPSASYGYGIAVDRANGDRILRHTGGMISFMSALHVNLDTAQGAFASINAQQGYRPNRVAQYALQLLSAHQRRLLPPLAPPANEDNPLPDSAGYAGTYVSDTGRRLSIGAHDGALFLMSAHRSARLQHLAGDAFLAGEPGFELYPLVFEREGATDADEHNSAAVVGLGHGAQYFARDGKPGETGRSADLQIYEGVYASDNPWIGTVRVVERRGRLWLHGVTPLEPLGNHLFRYADEPSSPETAEFSAIVLGKAQLLVLSGDYLRRVTIDEASP